MIPTLGVLFILALSVGQPATNATSLPTYEFASPLFGLATAPDGSLLVADAGAGIVRFDLRRGIGSLVAELPGVTDVAPVGRDDMFAITGLSESPDAQKLFRISRGHIREIADLFAFEEEFNPDGGDPAAEGIDSNPFDVEVLSGGRVLVADAGANDLLIIDQSGDVDWVATLPVEVVSTENLQGLLGCPSPPPLPPFLEGVCDVSEMPAQAVATSVAVGPDGAYYVSELKGLPGPIGASRIWRIEPGTLHAHCGSSPACTDVAVGFTSIVDLKFGPDGKFYVVEIDEASFMAIELTFFLQLPPPGLLQGGTVNVCDADWDCTVLETGLTIPIAVTVGRDGTVYAAVMALIPGAAQVVALS